jgi:hypothetical protein
VCVFRLCADWTVPQTLRSLTITRLCRASQPHVTEIKINLFVGIYVYFTAPGNIVAWYDYTLRINSVSIKQGLQKIVIAADRRKEYVVDSKRKCISLFWRVRSCYTLENRQ